MDLEAPPSELEIPSASQFLAAFYPAIATAIICLVAFPLLRPHSPDVYDAKRERVRLGGSTHQRGDLANIPPELPKFTVDWLRLLASFSDDDILRFVGADGLMFIRYLRVCFQASCLMLVYGLCVLVPINASGTNKATQFEKFSASNVADGSQTLWAHFAGAYLFSFLLMYLLYREYQRYVELRQQYMKSPTVQSYSIVIRDIPKDVDRDTVERYLKSLLGDESIAIHLVEDARPYDKLIEEKDRALFGLESARAKMARNPTARPMHKLGFMGLWGEKVDSLGHYEKEVAEVNERIKELRSKEQGFAHAAIVTFETIRVATAFQNIPMQQQVRFMKVLPAPARTDLLWGNLGEPAVARWVRSLLVAGVVFFVIFCYIIPITFVASLANLNALARTKGLGWLQPVADYNPDFTAFLQGFVPPLITSIFFSMVPTLMAFLARQECLPAESDVQSTAIWYVFLFVLFDYFLVYTIAGSVAAKMDLLKHYAESPAEIVNLFATSLPAQSTFFMNLIMLAALSMQPIELLRVGPLFVTKLKRRFLASSIYDHLRAMTDDVYFHELYAFPMLVFLVMCAYASLAPFLMVFVLAYYGISYVVSLNQLLYIYNVPFHTGAKQFPTVFRCSMVAIVISQLLMIGVLGLKRMAIPSTLMIPLVAFTVWWGYEMSHQFRFVGNTLTLENLLATDSAEMPADTREALKQAYQLHQDAGEGMELSHKALQPLTEPYAITRDGLLDSLVEGSDDVELGEEAKEEGMPRPLGRERKGEEGTGAEKGLLEKLTARGSQILNMAKRESNGGK
ncbi:hypothetical protein NSK_000474 [Nannochloropsis salina CCMP1776]|uniref:CSC1/OSCA1-like 7TM region domain-containing protein n=1 Tax=Nannochloropsis salina CCMP1776 TaxID=1027361 RepID=A0A4D9D9K5_9STRA|nr:hypothetical protein NSK_000474 [Nannochloropsis salina CCMP1776]|eukprot:TFJ88120.1 hypothetical protein NSK_000474 [Nannochloropsis salina CCMP1776]